MLLNAVSAGLKRVERACRNLFAREVESRKGGINDLAKKEIVEADQRYLVRDSATKPASRLEKAYGCHVVRTDHCCRRIAHREQALSSKPPSRQAMVTLKDPIVFESEVACLDGGEKCFAAALC